MDSFSLFLGMPKTPNPCSPHAGMKLALLSSWQGMGWLQYSWCWEKGGRTGIPAALVPLAVKTPWELFSFWPQEAQHGGWWALNQHSCEEREEEHRLRGLQLLVAAWGAQHWGSTAQTGASHVAPESPKDSLSWGREAPACPSTGRENCCFVEAG